MHDQLVIIGAGGHGKVVADIARRTGQYRSVIFLDDDESLEESMGIPVQGKSVNMFEYIAFSDMFVAIGNADIREKLLTQLWMANADVPQLVHPQAAIGENVAIGPGTAVMAGAVINPDTVVGKGCIINTCASVDHGCDIADYVHVAVGACLAGEVRVGKRTWIGAGAVVRNNIDICDDCMIGVGAAVVKKIKNAGVYAGVPARRMYA